MNAIVDFLPIAILAVASIAGCDVLSPGDDTSDAIPENPEDRRLGQVESDLLSRINEERADASPSRPALNRDPGMDRIILWHVTQMADHRFLDHEDRNGRRSAERAQYYGDDPTIRCSEIIQWWSGPPSGETHYEGYRDSPPHHAAYMEEGVYNLGPTMWAGVAAVRGDGPDDTEFEGISGSYTGVLFCEEPVTIETDPFSE